jgi:hypothetical protein
MAGKYMEKYLFNILRHKGNTNKNNIEIPSYPSQNGYDEIKQNQQMLMRM